MYKDEQKHIRYIKSRYFDAEPNMYAIEEFIKVLNLKALVKQPACSKNVPSWSDFQQQIQKLPSFHITETSLSDFTKMI